MGLDITGLGAAFDFGSKVLDKIFPDPAARDAAKIELLRQQQAGAFKELEASLTIAQGQMAINQAEAASTNWFVAGPRPFILWGCGFSMLYVGLFEPIMRFVATVAFHYAGPFPAIDATLTTQVLLGLLGLAGMRTAEKMKGAEGNR